MRLIAALMCALACAAVVEDNARMRAQERQPSRTMALTFDDLPFVAVDQPYFPVAQIKTMELLEVLRKHRAPAIGFVNEGKLDAGGEQGRS